jgi:hypothetical protein
MSVGSVKTLSVTTNTSYPNIPYFPKKSYSIGRPTAHIVWKKREVEVDSAQRIGAKLDGSFERFKTSLLCNLPAGLQFISLEVYYL